MNSVQKRLFETMVAPSLLNVTGVRTAFIREISHITMLATIEFAEGGNVPLEGVPLVRQQGFHEPGPFPGDEVLVGFFNNETNAPVIVGSVDRFYAFQRRTQRDIHLRKGAGVPDAYAARTGEGWR